VANCAATIFNLKQIKATTIMGSGIMKIKNKSGNDISLNVFSP